MIEWLFGSKPKDTSEVKSFREEGGYEILTGVFCFFNHHGSFIESYDFEVCREKGACSFFFHTRTGKQVCDHLQEMLEGYTRNRARKLQFEEAMNKGREK